MPTEDAIKSGNDDTSANNDKTADAVIISMEVNHMASELPPNQQEAAPCSESIETPINLAENDESVNNSQKTIDEPQTSSARHLPGIKSVKILGDERRVVIERTDYRPKVIGASHNVAPVKKTRWDDDSAAKALNQFELSTSLPISDPSRPIASIQQRHVHITYICRGVIENYNN